jgi:hypothetical protein
MLQIVQLIALPQYQTPSWLKIFSSPDFRPLIQGASWADINEDTTTDDFYKPTEVIAVYEEPEKPRVTRVRFAEPGETPKSISLMHLLTPMQPEKTIVPITTTDVLKTAEPAVPMTVSLMHLLKPKATPGIKTIIARNLPRDITPDELKQWFTPFGDVRDVYIPLNQDKNSKYFGTIKGFALVKYTDPSFSAAAFTHFRECPLTIRGKLLTMEFANKD